MKTILSKLKSLTVICTVLLIGLDISRLISAELVRNTALIMYMHNATLVDNYAGWKQTADLLLWYTANHPQNKILRARVVGALIGAGNTQAAQKYALNLFDQTKLSTICEITDNNFIEAISRPPNHDSIKLLIFTDESAWRFSLHNNAVGTISYVPVLDSSTECVAWITANFNVFGDRYIELSQPVLLRANTNYRLSALVFVQNVQRAWFGIRSQWPGTQLMNVTGWRTIEVEFTTSNEPIIEIVHLIIDAGQGSVGIRQVKLEAIQ